MDRVRRLRRHLAGVPRFAAGCGGHARRSGGTRDRRDRDHPVRGGLHHVARLPAATGRWRLGRQPGLRATAVPGRRARRAERDRPGDGAGGGARGADVPRLHRGDRHRQLRRPQRVDRRRCRAPAVPHRLRHRSRFSRHRARDRAGARPGQHRGAGVEEAVGARTAARGGACPDDRAGGGRGTRADGPGPARHPRTFTHGHRDEVRARRPPRRTGHSARHRPSRHRDRRHRTARPAIARRCPRHHQRLPRGQPGHRDRQRAHRARRGRHPRVPAQRARRRPHRTQRTFRLGRAGGRHERRAALRGRSLHGDGRRRPRRDRRRRHRPGRCG